MAQGQTTVTQDLSFDTLGVLRGSVRFGSGAAASSGTVTITVTVNDGEAPRIECPNMDIIVECGSPLGAPVEFNVSATDNCDNNTTVTCSPASGSLFPPGTTTVTCTATDSRGNQSRCLFRISVIEEDPAVLSIRQDGENVLISWPITCALYDLEQTFELNPPIRWEQVTEVPLIVNGRYQITTSAGEGMRYFRLKKI
jgi:hypothetical protein